uniref:AB hydrolase-1 domain-containing protein n=1 Tax=Anopheles atroparvus TaxID=41427 RepID=A0A182JI73_ANOAO
MDGTLTSSELIRKYGYPIENYEITTGDGYILSLIRIPSRNLLAKRSPPILLVHGLFASSADFLIIGPNNSLAYLLADRGYDVWLVDLRGNRYSHHHEHLRSDSKEYWDFSWHEMGYYDLPATVDRILELTHSKRLYYIGYSQGTTAFFVMVTTRPEYNGKIARMYALAPAAYVQHVRSPIFRWLGENGPALKAFFDHIGLWQLFPYNSAQYALQKVLCPMQKPRTICARLVEQLVGPNPRGTDGLAQFIIAGHNPSGASTKQLLHFSQLYRFGRFQQLAYDRIEDNLRHYGSTTPPAYNLTLATIPVLIFYGLNDWMVDPRNMVQLGRELPNLVSINAVEDKQFNHLDFVLAKQLALIKKYGYRARQYTVRTNDGYQLIVHRMQRKSGTNPDFLPVLVVHGLLGTSADWVIAGPENALGYLLADAGYDVWLANTRGNRYSRQHITLSPEDAEFWNFSWHEKGMRDLPAMIDFILNERASKARDLQQLYYIGYSEGGSVYYVLTSSFPDYNAKIRQAHTLAPAVLLNNMRSPLLMPLIGNSPTLLPLLHGINLVELFPWSEAQNGFLRTMCPPTVANNQCASLFANLFGPNPSSLDLKVVQAVVGHFPAGAAFKEVEHFHQIVQSGVFRPYVADGSESPVEPYNLSASWAPAYIYYGMNDWLVHPGNVPRFAAELPNVRRLLAV